MYQMWRMSKVASAATTSGLALILTFSLREKELPLSFSPVGKEGRAAPSEGRRVGLGEVG